jgi:hypothetical protein
MSNPNQAGKGDTPRPVDGDAYRDNYEAAFRKTETPAKRTPKSITLGLILIYFSTVHWLRNKLNK